MSLRLNVSAASRERQPPAGRRPNEFVSDALFDGRRLRALTMSMCSRARRWRPRSIKTSGRAGRLGGDTGVARGSPRAVRVDDGPEFVSKALDWWAYENGVT